MNPSRTKQLAVVTAAAAILTACGRPNLPAVPPVPSAAYSWLRAGCYVTKIDPTRVNATITFYGWPDNDPPGRAIAHPVIHQRAAGQGTYCDPTTFATERKNNPEIPYGMKIYVPLVQRYFIREDDCAASGPPKGHGNNGCYRLWFDLWVGGNRSSEARAVIKCENELTPDTKVDVILNPKANLPVEDPGPIYRNDPPPLGTCLGKPVHTIRKTIFPN